MSLGKLLSISEAAVHSYLKISGEQNFRITSDLPNSMSLIY